MNRLCFWLACFFGLLSAVFGAYSIFCRARVPDAEKEIGQARWGEELLQRARRLDKLIFFEVEGAGSREFSPAARKILESRYICVKLSPQKYPADNAVLWDIYKQSGARGKFSLGILSPRGAPIFLASSFSTDIRSPFYDAACLMGALAAYQKNRNADFFSAQSDISLFRRADFPSLFAAGNSVASLADLAIFFAAADWGENTALLSENARLAARLARSHSAIALEISETAYEALLNASLSADKFSSKLLIARALSEYSLLMLAPSAQQNFLRLAGEILSFRDDADGLFYENSVAILRDNALAVSVIARACALSEDAKYRAALESSCAALSAILQKTNIPPCVLSANKSALYSETQCIGCALLARAFIDAYIATSNREYLAEAMRVFELTDSLFADKRGGGWYCNLPRSMFSSSYRAKNFSDAVYPSDNGEAAQVLADLCRLRGANPSRLINIASNFNYRAGLGSLENASLKLSLLSNPIFRKLQLPR